jgi:hypothetical protein
MCCSPDVGDPHPIALHRGPPLPLPAGQTVADLSLTRPQWLSPHMSGHLERLLRLTMLAMAAQGYDVVVVMLHWLACTVEGYHSVGVVRLCMSVSPHPQSQLSGYQAVLGLSTDLECDRARPRRYQA